MSKIPERYIEGEWTLLEHNFAVKSVQNGNTFVLLYGFLVDDGEPESVELVPISIVEYPFQ